MAINKVTMCPKSKWTEIKGRRCKKCEHYNPKKWFCKGKEIDVFCMFDMTESEKKYLK